MPVMVGCERGNRRGAISTASSDMPIPLDHTCGTLPRGRYLADLLGLKSEFVESEWASASTTRTEIWDHFETVTELFRKVDPELAHAVWVGGSFVTTTVDPDDIDLTYLLDGGRYEALSNTQRKKITSLAARDGNISRLRSKHGLRVDCFTIVCHPVPLPWKDLTAEEAAYFRTRGLWDDWWQRSRTGPKEALPTEADAKPVRGYLEVLL